jgi:asparagine synthase (glutamine-hydrolysing)
MDLSLFSKGALARFGVDMRDPLTDRRLVEFCLGVPIGQLTAGGRSRGLARLALADRLPASTLERRTRGYQAADWHVGLSADRERVTRDLAGLAALPAAAGLLDIDRLRTLAARWPDGHWERDEVRDPYRMVLLRGLAVGRFLTRTLGANG